MDPPADQSKYWDATAAIKEFTHPLDSERFRRFLSADARILDYGCGHGRLCAQLNHLGYQGVKGVDFSQEMIRIAKLRHPELDFSVVDGSMLPYAAGSFDAILLMAVLTCIPSNETQRSLIAELSRVLRPGGLLLLSDYPLQTDERNKKRYESNASEFACYGTFRLPDGGVVRHHAESWFSELLADYKVEEIVEVHGRTMNGNPARILQIWARKNPSSTPP